MVSGRGSELLLHHHNCCLWGLGWGYPLHDQKDPCFLSLSLSLSIFVLVPLFIQTKK
ncbi:hypothetical protein DsansV1_C18g0153101 [Dioscorea sansibarensis]